jgi:hypothetical protein
MPAAVAPELRLPKNQVNGDGNGLRVWPRDSHSLHHR